MMMACYFVACVGFGELYDVEDPDPSTTCPPDYLCPYCGCILLEEIEGT